jgi:hypothetical protein
MQTQLYVNRHADRLEAAVLAGLPALAELRPRFEWVVPQPPRFSEARGAGMLDRIGRPDLRPAMKEFWPARGAVWDALAVLHIPDSTTGALLCEGKSYPREMYSQGTAAGDPTNPKSLASYDLICRSVASTQRTLGLEVDVRRWIAPRDEMNDGRRRSTSLYQTANRICHALWLRERVPATFLCHLLYVNDQTMPNPTSRAEWDDAIIAAEEQLGIEHLQLEWAGHAYLDALDPVVELA